LAPILPPPKKNQSSSVDVQGQLAFSFKNPLSSNNPFADLLLGNIQQYTQNQANFFSTTATKSSSLISRMIGASPGSSPLTWAFAGALWTVAGKK